MPEVRIQPEATHEIAEARILEPKALGRQSSATKASAAVNDNQASAELLSQYYTRPDVAAHLYDVFLDRLPAGADFQMVEPSAGAGAFFKLMPAGSLAYDVEPKFPGVQTKDFLTVQIESDRPVAIVGNPPFGRNASMAVRFFNHAAPQCEIIAFILPRSFRKAKIENRLHRSFHRVYEEEVEKNAFLFRGKEYDVSAVFQIWERRAEPRALRHVQTTHPDFEFTTPDRANFAIARVGAHAGRIHHRYTMSRSSHFFIRGDVEHIMKQLDFGSVTGNVASNPSLSKGEIVHLYIESKTMHAG